MNVDVRVAPRPDGRWEWSISKYESTWRRLIFGKVDYDYGIELTQEAAGYAAKKSLLQLIRSKHV